jgi:ArsR family metal-binding transcriptional regulator
LEEKMLIEAYDLELFTPPCKPGSETWSAVARLKIDISEVLPYLNATLPGAIYNPAARALTWQKGKHGFAFRPHKIAAGNLVDRAEAEQVVKALIKMVNQTWERRREIEPDFNRHQRLTPMAVFKLLPGTNCTQCGQPTCFNFALKVVANQQKLESCPPLFQPELVAQLAQLRAMVMDAPAIN